MQLLRISSLVPSPIFLYDNGKEKKRQLHLGVVLNYVGVAIVIVSCTVKHAVKHTENDMENQ